MEVDSCEWADQLDVDVEKQSRFSRVVSQDYCTLRERERERDVNGTQKDTTAPGQELYTQHLSYEVSALIYTACGHSRARQITVV